MFVWCLTFFWLALLHGTADADWEVQSSSFTDALPIVHASDLLPDASDLHLSSITNAHSYVALTHVKYPNHRVRVKKTNFCDPTVKCAVPCVRS
jgi:hypothetical protein